MAELKDINQKVTLSDEHIDFKWLNLKSACEIVKYQQMIDVLNECNDYLLKN